MNRPDANQLLAIAQVAGHNPRFVEWIEEWYLSELTRLPQTVNNAAVAQGRCQALAEMVEVLKKAPGMVA